MINEEGIFDADELLALARLDVERGALDQALARLKQAQSKAEQLPEVVAELARIYAKLGLRAKAKAAFERYLKVNPGAITERFQMGMVLFEDSKLSDALGVWTEVLAKESHYPPALFYGGLALARTGNLDKAQQSLNELLTHVEADNLYFGKGKELLDTINSGRFQPDAQYAETEPSKPGTRKTAAYKQH